MGWRALSDSKLMYSPAAHLPCYARSLKMTSSSDHERHLLFMPCLNVSTPNRGQHAKRWIATSFDRKVLLSSCFQNQDSGFLKVLSHLVTLKSNFFIVILASPLYLSDVWIHSELLSPTCAGHKTFGQILGWDVGVEPWVLCILILVLPASVPFLTLRAFSGCLSQKYYTQKWDDVALGAMV